MSTIFKATMICDNCGIERTVELAGKNHEKIDLRDSAAWWFRFMHWLTYDGHDYCPDCADGLPGRKERQPCKTTKQQRSSSPSA